MASEFVSDLQQQAAQMFDRVLVAETARRNDMDGALAKLGGALGTHTGEQVTSAPAGGPGLAQDNGVGGRV